MIERYTLPEMAAVWSAQRRLERWKDVEVLALEAWERLGVVPPEAVEAARAAPTPTPEAVAERERVTDHDVAAFVDVLAASMREGGRWLHYGLTSSDVVDTANGALLAEATDLLREETARLFEALRGLAFTHRDTVMVGRTHGVWAEPITFGLKVATWAFELARDHERLTHARGAVAVGKISGAVGTYAHVPPDVERHVCERLGLGIEPASSQVVHRDRHAELLGGIATTGASLERIATEIRHLQRSEVREAFEPFGKGQKGSSAMPHKRNPIRSERISGLARLLRSYAEAAFQNVALWHERDISHSSVERVVFPDATTVLHYMLRLTRSVIEGLEVDAERMRANLAATRGLVFSQAVLLALVDAGMDRDAAYRLVQRHALRVWEEGGELRDALAADPDLPLSTEALDACFSLERMLRHVPTVLERLEAVTLPR